jgi:hypothetical protein
LTVGRIRRAPLRESEAKTGTGIIGHYIDVGKIYSLIELNWRDPDALDGNWSGSVNWWNGASAQAPAGSEILRFGNNHQLTMTNDLSGTPRTDTASTSTPARPVPGPSADPR